MKNKRIRLLLSTSILKTLLFNFHYLPFSQAIRLPIFVSRRTVIRKLKGKITINCPIRPFLIKIGFNEIGFQDIKYQRTVWSLTGEIVVNGSIFVGKGSKFAINGRVVFGDNFIVTGNSTVICNEIMHFGTNSLISWDVLLMDTDFHKIRDINNVILNPDKGIYIGNNCWIGCRNTILKGAYLPDNSVLAANSLYLQKRITQNCIYGHNGRVIKENIHWTYN